MHITYKKILHFKFSKDFNPSINLEFVTLVCGKIICEKQTFSSFYFNFFILTSFLFCTSIKTYAYIKVIGTPQLRHVLIFETVFSLIMLKEKKSVAFMLLCIIYRKFSIQRPGRLSKIQNFRGGAYSEWVLIQEGRLLKNLN